MMCIRNLPFQMPLNNPVMLQIYPLMVCDLAHAARRTGQAGLGPAAEGGLLGGHGSK